MNSPKLGQIQFNSTGKWMKNRDEKTEEEIIILHILELKTVLPNEWYFKGMLIRGQGRGVCLAPRTAQLVMGSSSVAVGISWAGAGSERSSVTVAWAWRRSNEGGRRSGKGALQFKILNSICRRKKLYFVKFLNEISQFYFYFLKKIIFSWVWVKISISKNYCIGQMKWQYVLKNALRKMYVWTMHRRKLERRQRVNEGQWKVWYANFLCLSPFFDIRTFT